MKSRKRMRTNDSYECKSFADLSIDILTEIFCKLPLESIICCRYVCKSWYSSTHDPFFIVEHMNGEIDRRQLVVHENPEPSVVNFLLLNIDDKKVRRIQLRDPELKDFMLESSCNGLLCLSRYDHFDPVILYNPITRERLTLPPFRQTRVRRECTRCSSNEKMRRSISNHKLGLGFDTVSRTYKVIRSFEDHNKSQRYQYYMITVGKEEDTWKKILPPYYLQNYTLSHATYWNGAIFWTLGLRARSTMCILVFDLHVRKFQVLRFPRIPRPPPAVIRLSLLRIGYWEYLALVEYDGMRIRLWKVIGEKIGEYSLRLKHEYDISMRWDRNNSYKVVANLNGDGFLLQVSSYDGRMLNRRDHFTKFLPGATTPYEIINFDGMHRNFTALINYKPTLISPRLI